MKHKYIRKNTNSYSIIKDSKIHGKFSNLDDALFLRDLLIKNEWDMDSINEIYEVNGEYLLVKVIDDKLHVLARNSEKPSPETIEKLVKRQIRNPNNSKYGLNITKVLNTYVIKKQIAGNDYIFGYYENLSDAEFVRNYLLDHNWNVGEFSQIEYDEETSTYRVVEVIDDKVYVLNTFKSRKDIDIEQCHIEFLNKITKHKLGLANHPSLFELVENIPELEKRFSTKAHDEVWAFKSTENPLNDIIFNLTPFQKSVYDVIDDSAFEDIKKSLIRYKSGNFDEKIRKNLDELEKLGLIFKNQNHYMKRN